MKDIRIEEINDNTIAVNGKTIYKDPNDIWVSQIALTPNEKQVFAKYMHKKGIEIK